MHVSASSPRFSELLLLNTHCQNFSALGLLAKQTENSYNSLIKTDSWRPFFIPDVDSLINEIKFLFLVLNELVHECIMGTGPDNTRGRVRLAPSRVYYQGRFP